MQILNKLMRFNPNIHLQLQKKTYIVLKRNLFTS